MAVSSAWVPFAIALGTLTIILFRPRRIDEARAALLGAFLMLLTGSLPVQDALRLVAASWNILLFFLGLMIIAACAEQAGLFAWLATWGARVSRGSGRRLLVTVCLVGT